MKRGMPQWLLDKMHTPPKAGAGIHGWLFSVARQLHAHLTPQQCVEALQIAVMRCDRRVSLREINDAVTNSQGVAWEAREVWSHDPDASTQVTPPTGDEVMVRTTEAWPKLHPPTRQIAMIETEKKVSGLADLWEKSPLVPDGYTSDDWLDALFPGNPYLCVARSHPRDSVTKRRDKLAWECGDMSFIVPSAMSRALGARKDGRPSPRCLANTGPRQYLIVEFDDHHGQDVHATLLWALHEVSLATGGPPLVLAVHSGGKSLHGWFKVEDRDEESLREWMSYAVQIGADPATWTRCQLVRMPAGTRHKEGTTLPQIVCYANL